MKNSPEQQRSGADHNLQTKVTSLELAFPNHNNFPSNFLPNATKANTRVSDENSEKTASTISFIIGKEIF